MRRTTLVFAYLAFTLSVIAQSNEPDPPVALTPDSIRGIHAVLVLDHYYVNPGEVIHARVRWSPMSDEDGKVLDALQAALPKGELAGYQIEARISKEDGRAKERVFWRMSRPIDAEGGPEIEIPANTFGAGTYRASLFLMSPGTKPLPFVYLEGASTGETVDLPPLPRFHVGHFPVRYTTTKVQDARPLLTKATFVDNPARTLRRYTAPTEALSRSVWDMVTYEGKIYFGSGDWDRNTGPAPIFQLSVDSNGHERTDASYIILGEAVQRFRVFDGRLYTPDIDPTDTESIGNLYEMSQGRWEKRRTIPNTLHVFDAAQWEGRLFVSVGGTEGAALYASADDGRSWIATPGDRNAMEWALRFTQMAVLGDSLLVMPMATNRSIWRLNRGGFERVEVNMFPGMRRFWRTAVARLESFDGAVLYTADLNNFSDMRSPSILIGQEGQPRKSPLYLLRNLEQGAEVVSAFKDAYVTDVDVNDTRCLVLTAEQRGNTFVGQLFRSADLVSWTRLAQFSADAVPFSVAELDGRYYVGLANRSNAADDEAAGAIFRIDGPPSDASRVISHN